MKIKLLGFSVIIIFFIFISTGCNKTENDTVSNSKLILQLITGNDLDGTAESNTVFSDVLTAEGIFNDSAEASVIGRLINPYSITEELTYYVDIIIDQIDIEYSRPTTGNVQGRDIPFSFSQKTNVYVPISGMSGETVITFGFVLVQHVAKLESPLVELVSYGQEKVLKMEAKCTFHSHDIGGHRLEPVVGYISVWFANFADATSSGGGS